MSCCPLVVSECLFKTLGGMCGTAGSIRDRIVRPLNIPWQATLLNYLFPSRHMLPQMLLTISSILILQP